VLDLEFSRDLARTIGGDIRYGYQAGLRNKPPDILCVTLAHLPNPEDAYSKLPHLRFS
jgi:hypothetical protein